MKEIEKLIDELPFNLYKEIEETCFKCGTIHKEKLRYELTISLLRHYDKNGIGHTRYHIFYNCPKLPSGDSNKYIGRATGFGQATLEEAIMELKGLLALFEE